MTVTGTGNLGQRRVWRVVTAMAAGAALGLALPSRALAGPDPCTTAGTVATCSGDQSDGISSATDFDPNIIRTLIVTALSADIAPGAGTPGIFYSGIGDLAIRYDAGPFAIATTGGADGIVATLQTSTVHTQLLSIFQTNVTTQTPVAAAVIGAAGEATAEDVDESVNEFAQAGSFGGATPGKLVISSAGDIDAAGDGIVATADSLLELSQTQTVAQDNSNQQTTATATADGAGAEATATQTNTQSNISSQTGTISGVSADAIAIANAGTVVAGGDGIVATSDATVRIRQVQTVAQDNESAQDGNSATALNGGSATATQTNVQSNANTQSATISDVATGGIAINNSGAIFAAGNGIVATSRVTAEVIQDQLVAQANDSTQNDNAASADGAASVATAVQESEQSNDNRQTATVEARAGTIRINNSGTIVAAGDGIVATTDRAASAAQNQTAAQTNDATQANITATATNGGTATAVQETNQLNSNDQTASAFGLEGDIFITNSGSIIAGGVGVRANALTGLVNSGLIVGGSGTAILETGSADTLLTLLPGSTIQGLVNLGGGVNTLVVGNGLNMATTFASVPDLIKTNGAPFAVSGATVHVVDPTGLALAGILLADTTGAVSEVLAGKFGGAANGAVAVATGNGAEITVTPVADTGLVTRAWAEVFGGWRDRSADAPAVGSTHLFGGAVAGVDAMTGDGLRVGGFVGGAAGRADIDHDAQDIDTETVFAGVYASRHAGAVRLDAAVTAGLAEHESTRLVANNLVAGGIETATAEYDGVFVSPELTRPTFAAMGTATVRPSLRVRYAGLWLDGYSESGSASNLTVDDRDVHILEARAQLALPMSFMSDEHGTATTELRVGVDGRTRLGSDKVDAVLVGQSLSFDPGGDDEVLGAFAAAAFAIALHNGVTITGAVEGGYGTDDTAHASGRLGARLDF